MNELLNVLYTMCGKCDHFVYDQRNDFDQPGIADFIHLDDGEKEHDHDAIPGETHTLKGWRDIMPELFEMFADGKIGPNSIHYKRQNDRLKVIVAEDGCWW